MAFWMLYAAGVGGLVVGAATLLETTVHARRRLLWAAALLATGLLPPFLPLLRRLSLAPSTIVVDLGEAIPAAADLASSSAADASTWSLDSVLLGAWLATSLLLAGTLLAGALRIRRRSEAWERREVDGFHVRVSPDLGPAVVGLRRPEIVLPEWVLELGAPERALILAHEDEHKRRGDPALLALGLLAPVAMPWNPAAWWGFARLRDAVETDCDGRVVSRVGGPVVGYARLLLHVGERTVGQVPLTAGFGERRSSLERRIRTMLGRTKGFGWKGLALRLVLAGLLVAAACTIEVNINTNDDDDDAVPTFEAAEAGVPIVEIPAPPDAATGEDEEAAVEPVEAEPTPPRVEEAILRVRRVPVEPASEPSAESEASPPDGPTFTPFTDAPRILNRTEIIRAMEESYPPLLRDAGIGGTVRLWFFIDAEGVVQEVRTDGSSGHEALDRAALRVAMMYRFEPARNRDEPVPVWVAFPITFQVR